MQKTHLKQLWLKWDVVILLATLKLALHLLTNTNYGFHRDEYLYLELGNHLGWGYMEVPPVIAALGKTALLLGGSLSVVRLFPTLVGVVTIILIGAMVRDLGGKKWAQAFACLAYILSPAFLRSNMLFQPVSFNQFCWFLSALLIVRLIKTENHKYWYWIGLVAGVGFLTKYSIGFFYAAFLAGIILTPHRKWLKTPYPYMAAGLALIIALPNILWQLNHNLPVVQHMSELSQTQLKNVEPLSFLTAQFVMHQAASIIWLAGLIYLFIAKRLANYRVIGWIYLGILLLLLLLSGKSYYTLGAYTMLLAVGGVAVENYLGNRARLPNYAMVGLLVILTIPVLPYGIPILSTNEMIKYCAYMKDTFSLDGPLYWEDGRIHTLPQDYADMHGWEEMAAKVGRLYHSLSPTEQKSCLIYGGSYSHTSSINYYRGKYDLPEVYSFHGSHLIWAPDSLNFDRQIMIDDVPHTGSPFFESIVLADSIENPNAREPGYIYYLTYPRIDVIKGWAQLARERKQVRNF